MNALRIALMAAVLQPGAATQVPGGSLEGVVVDQSTGRPISGATVELTGIASAPQDWRVRSFSTVTGADGRFAIVGVPPGTAYQLAAARSPDFIPGVHGQKHPDDAWVPIALTAGQKLTELRISLTALSSISGRITTDDGKPAGGERVMALAVRYRDGHRTLESESAAYTDSQGYYRIGGLAPGRYTVRIRPVIRASARRLTLGSDAVSLYYPGTMNPNNAGEIEVGLTATVDDVNLTMTETRLRRVQGVINNAESGSVVQNARVFLVPAMASPDSSLSREFASSNGEFDFRDVLPGDYTLFAVAVSLSGRLPIRLDEDARELKLLVHPDVDVEGRITVDDPALASALDFARVAVTVSPRSLATVDVSGYPGVMAEGRSPATPSHQSIPDRSGAFALKGLRAWPYFAEVSLMPGPDTPEPLRSAYLKAIFVGDTDVLSSGQPIDRSTRGDMRVVLGTDAGTLTGRIVDRDGPTMPYAVVVLVPDEPRRNRRDLYRTTKTDPGGRFSIQGIAPGSYKVFAWRSVDTGAWLHQEFLRPHEGSALPVAIGASETKSVEAVILPAIPPYK